MATTTTTQSTSGTGSTAAKTVAQSRTKLNANFDTFLKMLTTQLQYQDPLKPQDTAAFTNQLVMYSQVEQQLSGNEKLDSLIKLQQGQGINASLNYLGWEVSAETKDLPLQDKSATFSLSVEKPAKTIAVGIADSTGKVVRGLTLDGSKFTAGKAQEIIWDGKDNSGVQLPDGAYTLQLTATDTNNSAVKTTLKTFGVVTGIDMDASGNTVLKMGTVSLSPSNVKSVRGHTTPTGASA